MYRNPGLTCWEKFICLITNITECPKRLFFKIFLGIVVTVAYSQLFGSVSGLWLSPSWFYGGETPSPGQRCWSELQICWDLSHLFTSRFSKSVINRPQSLQQRFFSLVNRRAVSAGTPRVSINRGGGSKGSMTNRSQVQKIHKHSFNDVKIYTILVPRNNKSLTNCDFNSHNHCVSCSPNHRLCIVKFSYRFLSGTKSPH